MHVHDDHIIRAKDSIDVSQAAALLAQCRVETEAKDYLTVLLTAAKSDPKALEMEFDRGLANTCRNIVLNSGINNNELRYMAAELVSYYSIEYARDLFITRLGDRQDGVIAAKGLIKLGIPDKQDEKPCLDAASTIELVKGAMLGSLSSVAEEQRADKAYLRAKDLISNSVEVLLAFDKERAVEELVYLLNVTKSGLHPIVFNALGKIGAQAVSALDSLGFLVDLKIEELASEGVKREAFLSAYKAEAEEAIELIISDFIEKTEAHLFPVNNVALLDGLERWAEAKGLKAFKWALEIAGQKAKA